MTPETLLILASVAALVSLACALASFLLTFADDGGETSEDVPPEEVRAYLLTLSGAVTCRD